MLSSFTRRPTRQVAPAVKQTQFVDAVIKHVPGAKPDLRPHAQVAPVMTAEEDAAFEASLPEMLRRDYVYPETVIPTDLPHGSRPAMPRHLGARGGRK